MSKSTPYGKLAAAIAESERALSKPLYTLGPEEIRAIQQALEALRALDRPELRDSFAKWAQQNKETARAILGSDPFRGVTKTGLLQAPVGSTRRDQLGLNQTDEPYSSPLREALDQLARPPRDMLGSHRRNEGEKAALPSATRRPLSVEVNSVEDIGKLVRDARRRMGMTQQRFADLAGVGRRFLIELERGKATLEIGRVLAVCRAAGLKVTLAP